MYICDLGMPVVGEVSMLKIVSGPQLWLSFCWTFLLKSVLMLASGSFFVDPLFYVADDFVIWFS